MYFNMFFLENELYKLSKMNKIKVLGDVLELVRLICHKNNKAHSEIISSHCTMCIVYIVVQTSQVCVVSLLIFIEKVCAMKNQYQFQDRRNESKFGWDIPICFAESALFGCNRVNVTNKKMVGRIATISSPFNPVGRSTRDVRRLVQKRWGGQQ